MAVVAVLIAATSLSGCFKASACEQMENAQDKADIARSMAANQSDPEKSAIDMQLAQEYQNEANFLISECNEEK